MPTAPLLPAQHRLTTAWFHGCWLYGNLAIGLGWGLPHLTWQRSLASMGLMLLTVGLGHAVGLHRGIIHRAFQTSRFWRGVLAYLSVQAGVGGPISWLKSHYYRDYWQNQPASPAYFRYDHPIWQDFHWNHHLALHSVDDAVYDIPPADLHDPWLVWLEKTWVLHVLTLAGLVWWGFGFEAMAAVVCLRVAVSMLGHWFVTYVSHTSGYARYHVAGAAESGYNNLLLGVLSFGEGFHNTHHAHPRSARMGTAWYELDLGWLLVRGMEVLGLVWAVEAAGRTNTQKPQALVQPTRRWPWAG
jgi:fatty-acid desaturase